MLKIIHMYFLYELVADIYMPFADFHYENSLVKVISETENCSFRQGMI